MSAPAFTEAQEARIRELIAEAFQLSADVARERMFRMLELFRDAAAERPSEAGGP